MKHGLDSVQQVFVQDIDPRHFRNASKHQIRIQYSTRHAVQQEELMDQQLFQRLRELRHLSLTHRD